MEGGLWEDEIRTGSFPERQIKLEFQVKGARPWLRERRSGLARRSYNRLAADDLFASKSILGAALYCLNALLSHV